MTLLLDLASCRKLLKRVGKNVDGRLFRRPRTPVLRMKGPYISVQLVGVEVGVGVGVKVGVGVGAGVGVGVVYYRRRRSMLQGMSRGM